MTTLDILCVFLQPWAQFVLHWDLWQRTIWDQVNLMATLGTLWAPGCILANLNTIFVPLGIVATPGTIKALVGLMATLCTTWGSFGLGILVILSIVYQASSNYLKTFATIWALLSILANLDTFESQLFLWQLWVQFAFFWILWQPWAYFKFQCIRELM